MTLLANIFSFSTIFSRMFSRTHKLRYLRAISKKEKPQNHCGFKVFLECVDKKDAGAKPCVARVCGLLRLDFPFCNSNPQHLVMTDE